MQNLIGVTALTSKAVFSLPVRAAVVQWLAQGPRLWCYALKLKCSRAVKNLIGVNALSI